MIKMIQLNCRRCGKEFSKKAALHKGELKAGRTNFHCSRKCADDKQIKLVIAKCKNCNEEVIRKPCQILPSGNIFCSQSCSAKFNNLGKNRHFIQKKEKLCKICKSNISEKYCQHCVDLRRKNKMLSQILKFIIQTSIWNNRTIKDIGYSKNLATRNSYLRMRARTVIKNRPKICEKCGYSKYVECCHLKPVSEFPEDALIRTVNHPDNLKWLCPNCHKEHDLKLS